MTKRKGLPAIYYPEIKSEIPVYYNGFAAKLPNYTTKYGILAAEVTVITGHNTQIPLKSNKQKIDSDAAQKSTRQYDEELHDAEIDAKRIINKIVEHASFLPSDGEDLGFIRIKAKPDIASAKARITGITAMPGEIRIEWIKSIFDGVAVYASYDGQNFSKLDKDNRSPYDDTRKNKTENVPETRYYKLRFLLNDKEVGLESDVAKKLAEIY